MWRQRPIGGKKVRFLPGTHLLSDGNLWGLGLVICCLWWLGGCATVPYTGRQQLLMVSQGQEISLGYQAFEQVKRSSMPARDPRLQEMARRVGERLARAANRPDFRWE